MEDLERQKYFNKRQDIWLKLLFLAFPITISLFFGSTSYGLINGTFDLGRDGSWKEYSSNDFVIVLDTAGLEGIIPHSGNWAAWLGGADNENSILSQTIPIPPTATFLYYYYWLESFDPDCGYDSAEIRLGTNLLRSYALCETTSTSSWVMQAIDVSAFRGQSLVLSFQVFTDNFSASWSNFFIDTVSISQTQNQYFVSANSKGNGSGQISSDIGMINYSYPTHSTGTTAPLDEGSSITIIASSNIDGIVSWDNCISSGGIVSGNESATATCIFNSISSDKLITATFTTNKKYIYLPLILKNTFTRSCPGGPGSPPSLSEVTFSPNSVPVNSFIFINAKFSIYDPDGDMGNGTFNWAAPSGKLESLPLPTSLDGVIYGYVDYTGPISTDNQKGSFKIPTWLVDKAGNCSNIYYVDWTQY